MSSVKTKGLRVCVICGEGIAWRPAHAKYCVRCAGLSPARLRELNWGLRAKEEAPVPHLGFSLRPPERG